MRRKTAGGEPAPVAGAGARDGEQSLLGRQGVERGGDLGAGASGATAQLGGGRPRFAGLAHPEEERRRLVAGHRRQRLRQGAAAAAAPQRVEHLAAAERQRRRRPPHDEAIAARRDDRRRELHLGESGRPRRDGFGERAQAAGRLAGEQMEADRLRGVERGGRLGQEREAQAEAPRDGEGAGLGEGGAAAELVELDAGELERGALARQRLLPPLAVDLDAAHPDGAAGRQQLQRVPRGDLAAHQRAAHHRAQAGEMKGAVDRQARRSGA